MNDPHRWRFQFRTCAILLLLVSGTLYAEDRPAKSDDLLTTDQWQRLEKCVDKALEYLAANQNKDGSFKSPVTGQPGITSLCVLAFAAKGHLPEQGQYGAKLESAIDYVLRTQQDDGLLFPMPIDGRVWPDNRHKTGIYNHVISALMLSEVYGTTSGPMAERIEQAIRKAVQFTRAQQKRPKPHPHDRGGWRYLVMDSGSQNDSDLSVTGWQILFLRSAKNGGFDVADESIDSAMEYVRRAYEPVSGTFSYGHANLRPQNTRGMIGSGILSLSMGGEHDSEMAQKAGQFLLKHPLDQYNRIIQRSERFHYSAYYCSQGMYQLGGEYWRGFYPSMMKTLVQSQRGDGSWLPEANRDGEFGSSYTTALSVLALAPIYQLLPIYQR